MKIQAIVFDFGNVLGFFSHRKAAEQLVKLSRRVVSPEDMVRYLFYTKLEPTFEVAGISASQMLAELRQEFDLEGDEETIIRAYVDMFTPNDEICSLIPELQGKAKLLLLSNTNELHYGWFRKQFADVLDRFDVLVASHEARLRKPDPALYHLVQTRANCAGSEIVFVDDMAVNIEAAKGLGWNGIVYGPGVDIRSELGRYL
jgi:putative hydrolase of the HAD superfamily